MEDVLTSGGGVNVALEGKLKALGIEHGTIAISETKGLKVKTSWVASSLNFHSAAPGMVSSFSFKVVKPM